MFNVTVNTGPSQSFDVMVDRVPVAGDYVTDAQDQAWLITIVSLTDGGGTQTFGKQQNAAHKGGAKGPSAPK